jgi:hypothetical protein
VHVGTRAHRVRIGVADQARKILGTGGAGTNSSRLRTSAARRRGRRDNETVANGLSPWPACESNGGSSRTGETAGTLPGRFFADLQLHRSAAALRHLLALVFLTVFADAATQMLFECRCARRHRVQRHPLCQPAESHGGLVAHLPRPEIYRRGALSTPLSTDGRERARVIRGLNKFCPGQPPPADKDVLVPPLLKPLHDLPSSFGGGLAWLRLLDVAFRAPNLSS